MTIVGTKDRWDTETFVLDVKEDTFLKDVAL
jgi:hypothetical protein